MDKLTRSLEERSRETEALRKKLSVKDLQIQNLKMKLNQSEAQLRQRDNNNPGGVNSHHSRETSEDKLYKVVAAVEALSTQVPEDIRSVVTRKLSYGTTQHFVLQVET